MYGHGISQADLGHRAGLADRRHQGRQLPQDATAARRHPPQRLRPAARAPRPVGDSARHLVHVARQPPAARVRHLQLLGPLQAQGRRQAGLERVRQLHRRPALTSAGPAPGTVASGGSSSKVEQGPFKPKASVRFRTPPLRPLQTAPPQRISSATMIASGVRTSDRPRTGARRNPCSRRFRTGICRRRGRR